VQAFKDTSPFLLFSSSPLPQSSLPQSLQEALTQKLQSKHQIMENAKEFLSGCPSEVYFVVEQPDVSAAELRWSPFLKELSADKGLKTAVMVNEVVGMMGGEGDELVKLVEEMCGKESVVVRKAFSALAGTVQEREEMLRERDSTLRTTFQNNLLKDTKYTLIYLTTPSTLPASTSAEKAIIYEPDFNDALHIDLKRNLAAASEHNSTIPDQRPLFEKYQFLSPGLFMGLLVGFILISILSVGISAVASLQVSYGAFDKEMGPAAQKKQQ